MERQAKAIEAEVVEILGENVQAVELFMVVGTQWIAAGMGALIGLNYVAVESSMRMKCIPRLDRPDLFDRIRIIESAVLAEWGKQRKKDARKS